MKKFSKTLRTRKNRSLRVESLEHRNLLAGDCFINNLDVSGDQFVSPVDALILINDMNARGIHEYNPLSPEEAAHAAEGIYLDVNFDGFVAPNDVLLIVNDLNRNGSHPFSYECPKDTALFVTVKSTGTADTVVSHDTVTALRFEAHAEGGDALLTTLTLIASQGDAANASVYSLWADTDDNGITDTKIGKESSQGNSILFDNIVGGGYVVPNNESVVFEIRAEIADALVSSSLQLTFVDGDAITAEKLEDGSDLSEITITRQPSMVFTLRDHGDVTVTRSATPVAPSHILGGTRNRIVLRFDIRSEFEAGSVTYLGFGTTETGQSIDRLDLVKPGETVPYATATRAGAREGDAFGVTLSNQELMVAKGSVQSTNVKLVAKTDTDGGISGEKVTVFVRTVNAVGVTSADNLEPILSQVVSGPTHTIVMSEPGFILDANPDADGTAIGIGPRPSGQFKVMMTANNNMLNGPNRGVLDLLTFVVKTTNVQLDLNGFAFYNKADASLKVHIPSSSIREQSPGTYIVTVDHLATSGLNTTLGSGEQGTFVLETVVTNPQVSSSLQSLLRVDLDVGGANFGWYDTDFSVHNQVFGGDFPDTLIPSTQYSL